jgi:hypothetical protein
LQVSALSRSLLCLLLQPFLKRKTAFAARACLQSDGLALYLFCLKTFFTKRLTILIFFAKGDSFAKGSTPAEKEIIFFPRGVDVYRALDG